MNPGSIIVISPDTAVREVLAGAPALAHLRVVDVRPGPSIVDVVRRERPQIAIIDGIHDRSEAAQLEIAFLKDAHPEVQIIVLSERSSERDARVVEQGIFYYLATPPGRELVRIVEAAARTRPRARDAGGERSRMRQHHSIH